MLAPSPNLEPAIPPELVEPTDPAERERLLIEAEAQIDAGNYVTSDEMRSWLGELAVERPAPPPCDR